jgi:hypothetical protein
MNAIAVFPMSLGSLIFAVNPFLAASQLLPETPLASAMAISFASSPPGIGHLDAKVGVLLDRDTVDLHGSLRWWGKFEP